MNLYVLNQEFETVGLIDKYASLIWTERFNGVDDFELEIPLDDFVRTGMRPDFYIWQKKSKNLMVMEKFELKYEDGEARLMKVTGRGLESILDRRITEKDLSVFKVDPDTMLERLLNENFINPTDADRKIQNVRFFDSNNEEVKAIEYSNKSSYAEVLSIILDICGQNENLGFKAWFNDNFEFCYQFYKGNDYSWAADAAKWLVYSPKFNNLLSTNFKYDNKTYKNHIFVYGEEASTTQSKSGRRYYWPQVTFTMTRDDTTGVNRKETTIDLSNVPRTLGAYRWGENGYEEIAEEDQYETFWKLDEEDYKAILEGKAKKEALDDNETIVYEAEADENMQWVLGKDIQLGDIVQVVNEVGLESRCRIESIIFSHDDGDGVRYYPTLVSVDNKITQKGGTIVW